MPDALSDSVLTTREAGRCVQNEHTTPLPPGTVSGNRLLALLITIGWTEREFARRTGRHQTVVRRWIAGRSAVDPQVAAWLEMLAALVAAHPAPGRLTRCRVASGR